MEVHTGTNTGGADRTSVTKSPQNGGFGLQLTPRSLGGVQNPTALVKGIQLF